MIYSSFSDIAGLYREATAGLRDEVDKLESRLAWLNKGRQQDSDIADRTRAKLAATQAELARLKPAVMPSKHSMLAWDELITNGQRKALASSIAFQNDLPVTGKEAFWLAAATHGGYLTLGAAAVYGEVDVPCSRQRVRGRERGGSALTRGVTIASSEQPLDRCLREAS